MSRVVTGQQIVKDHIDFINKPHSALPRALQLQDVIIESLRTLLD